MRVLIIGAVSGNGGDAAILQAQAIAMRRAAGDEPVHVDVIDLNPDVTPLVLPDAERVLGVRPKGATPPAAASQHFSHRVRRTLAARLPRRLRGALQRLRKTSTVPAGTDRSAQLQLQLPREEVLAVFQAADVVLYTGGTSLVPHYSLDDKIAYMRVALLMGKPLVLGTQSMGPFPRPAHADAMRRIVAGADAVLLREERSLQHLRDIDAPTDRVSLLPDVVFTMADPQNDPRTEGPLRVAVSTRAWAHFTSTSGRQGSERYAEAIRETVSWLVRERGAEITFLSTCQGLPQYWTDDSRMAMTIAEGLAPDVKAQVTVRRDHVPPDALQREYGRFDLVLATRMHAAILALDAGTPVVAVAYEFKTIELFRSLELPDLAHDIETLTGAALTASVTRALDDLPALRRHVSDVVRSWQPAAQELGEHVVRAARAASAPHQEASSSSVTAAADSARS